MICKKNAVQNTAIRKLKAEPAQRTKPVLNVKREYSDVREDGCAVYRECFVKTEKELAENLEKD